MKLEHIPIDQSVGRILVHNVVDPAGRKALAKGRAVRPEDVETLRRLGKETVYVLTLGPGDVREDEAAARIAAHVAGRGIEATRPSGGRVNFYASERGFLRVDAALLAQLNALRGITLATRPRYSALAPKTMVATLKTIGLALPQTTLREAEELLNAGGPILRIAPVARPRVAVIFTGSENGRTRVPEVFGPPIRERIERNGAQVVSEEYVPEETETIGRAIERALARADLVLLAGETSIMDAEDTTPRGIQRAGGRIELYGAPVEPGNLLLLAYCGELPIIGAPGCVKSRETNVVDLILPRLLAGERLARADIAALAEGGLLVG